MDGDVSLTSPVTFRPAVRTDLHSNGAEPLAVFQGKMPAQADVGLKPARKRNKHKSDFFQLCPRFEERGICNLPGCELAHGAAELEQRKLDTE